MAAPPNQKGRKRGVEVGFTFSLAAVAKTGKGSYLHACIVSAVPSGNKTAAVLAKIKATKSLSAVCLAFLLFCSVSAPTPLALPRLLPPILSFAPASNWVSLWQAKLFDKEGMTEDQKLQLSDLLSGMKEDAERYVTHNRHDLLGRANIDCPKRIIP